MQFRVNIMYTCPSARVRCIRDRLWISYIKQEYQTDTKYARRICGKFNGDDNLIAIIQECLGDLAG